MKTLIVTLRGLQECMKFGLHPTGSISTLRRRLLQNYSARRMAKVASTSKEDVEHAQQHFFELGEPELRLIPALAFCPFLDRLLDVFCEDDSGFLHFEEFLNMYSVFSAACPTETKIRYAWCIYDLNATGDIGLDEIQALVMSCWAWRSTTWFHNRTGKLKLTVARPLKIPLQPRTALT